MEKKKFTAKLLFGSNAVEAYEQNKRIPVSELEDLGEIKYVEFETEAELNAYLKGIRDAIDWNDAIVLRDSLGGFYPKYL